MPAREPGNEARATGDGGSTHPDDTYPGALCQNGGLDCWTNVVRHPGREEKFLSTLDLQ